MYQTTLYDISFPKEYLHPENPLTVEGVALGRMLFYDPILDGKSNRSCATCHLQEEAFSQSQVNSLAHINLGWSKHFLRNGEINGLMEDIMKFEVQTFFNTDVSKINANQNYRKLFKQAFNVDEITHREIEFALAQFERTLISSNNKYDRYQQRKYTLTPSEQRGMELYFSEAGDCFHCHGSTPLLTDGQFHNNGLDANPADGRMAVTGNPRDKGKFKSSTLRNIALTAPYMHDGRFNTLEEVIDFYSEGLSYSETIDPLMKGIQNKGVQLTQAEKDDLLSFLHCFTDSTFIANKDFSNPF